MGCREQHLSMPGCRKGVCSHAHQGCALQRVAAPNAARCAWRSTGGHLLFSQGGEVWCHLCAPAAPQPGCLTHVNPAPSCPSAHFGSAVTVQKLCQKVAGSSVLLQNRCTDGREEGRERREGASAAALPPPALPSPPSPPQLRRTTRLTLGGLAWHKSGTIVLLKALV